MKKITFIIAVLLISIGIANAQNSNPKSNPGTSNKDLREFILSDAGLKNISEFFVKGVLTAKLSLNTAQGTGVSNALVSFFKSKVPIQGRSDYKQQQDILFHQLKTDLSAILTSGQLSTFLSLAPGKNDPDPLTIIFY